MIEMSDRIFLASPHMSEEGYEREFIQEAFDTNWIAPLGANVDGFENEICQKTGAKAAVALSSGTSAIHLALKLAGLKKGERVFCQSLTFSATANPIVYEAGIPVFIDSEPDTWNMSPAALESAFRKYPDTRIVMLVHLYGVAAKIDEIKEICSRHQAVLIEDAAESLGTVYNGQWTGTFGDYGIYSFNGNKIITTSGGGMLVSNREDAEDKMQKAFFWATQSREKERYYQHKEIGYNYRMSNITAGIGRGQLKVLDKRIEKKRKIYQYYKKALSSVSDITMMPFDREECRNNCWLSCLTLSVDSRVSPLDIQLALEKENIESRPVWKPMHLQPVFSDCDYIDNGGVAEHLFKQGMCLPSDTKMTDQDLERVCGIVRSCWK